MDVLHFLALHEVLENNNLILILRNLEAVDHART